VEGEGSCWSKILTSKGPPAGDGNWDGDGNPGPRGFPGVARGQAGILGTAERLGQSRKRDWGARWAMWVGTCE
jgi:hypothetical protein